jgi:hypothetical protein
VKKSKGHGMKIRQTGIIHTKGLQLIGAIVLAIFLHTIHSPAADLPASPDRTNDMSKAIEGDADSMTNKTLMIISKLRGVKPAAVTLRLTGNRSGGPFEIDITGVSDSMREAETLSRELGSKAVVILDHASLEDTIRTNWAFRNGIGQQRTAPVGTTGLRPGAKRMYVWPEVPAPKAPSNVRISAQIVE